ncbi:Adenine phosphoribosyltransferase [Prochlorococcus marinus str. MIT 9321]|nr:Adenine phosphoribosyltransferase [Prochlorococcus marinus str. MIT 9322]KGG05682.1 Adenine phosphoribosyltransferase [Prochlorococcus marinus str. MIT 9321]
MRPMKKLEELISTYKDFPRKGINFKDVLEIIQEPEVFNKLITKMSSSKIIKQSEAIIAIDARGFIFGAAIALQSFKPMIVARKPGKLPGALVAEEYNLEYGKNSLSIQKKSLKKYNSYAIVDDLLATGGTVDCVANILERNSKKILGLITVVELASLKGRGKFNFPVESSISI